MIARLNGLGGRARVKAEIKRLDHALRGPYRRGNRARLAAFRRATAGGRSQRLKKVMPT